MKQIYGIVFSIVLLAGGWLVEAVYQPRFNTATPAPQIAQSTPTMAPALIESIPTATPAPTMQPLPARPTIDPLEVQKQQAQADAAATQSAGLVIVMTSDAIGRENLSSQMTATAGAISGARVMATITAEAAIDAALIAQAQADAAKVAAEAEKTSALAAVAFWAGVAAACAILLGGFGLLYWLIQLGKAAAPRREAAQFLAQIQPVQDELEADDDESPVPGVPMDALYELATGTVLFDMATGERRAKIAFSEANWTGSDKPFVKGGTFSILRAWLIQHGYIIARSDANNAGYEWTPTGLEWLESLLPH